MNLIKYLKKVYNPILFQGEGKSRKYFEGWYYKIVDESGENSFAYIPGISFDKNGEENHSFLQILDGNNGDSKYIKYNTSEFSTKSKYFQVKVKNNCFCSRGFKIDTENITANISISNLNKWPRNIFSPGAMGWFSFFTFMQCNHGVLSMKHDLKGFVEIEGKRIDFTNGIGYIEKDWGKEFPSKWIWIQCNHFEEENVSLMCSVAEIPFLFFKFTGFICGVYIKDKFFNFSTYTGAKIIKIERKNNFAKIVIVKNHYMLSLETELIDSGELTSPIEGEMKGTVNESLTSKLGLKIYKKRELIFSGKGKNVGLELAWENNL